MYTPDGMPLCDLCNCFTFPEHGYTFAVQHITQVPTPFGVRQLVKTQVFELCPICHQILHDENVELLYERCLIALTVIRHMPMPRPYCDALRDHCKQLVADFEGGAWCSHEEDE